MRSRLFRRRSATVAWIYVAVAFGILGTIVAARVLGLEEFGVFATALAAVGFFQVLLDLTVEESLTKYGFRYVAAGDWGRLRRLFRQTLLLKIAGGAFATVVLIALAPFADRIFGSPGVGTALLAACLLPLVQSSENVFATAFLLHGRYDLRGAYQAGSTGLRFAAIALFAPLGVNQALVAIVVAQAISTATITVFGIGALRRFPAGDAARAGRGRPGHSLVRPPVEHRHGRDLPADDARAAPPRRRRRPDRRRPVPNRPDAPDGALRRELAGAARPPHRADAGLGARRADARPGRSPELHPVGGRH